jgi:predicted ATPase
VAAVWPGVRIAGIEQPELHIHPKLQVVLGDLFILAVRNELESRGSVYPHRRFIIETHSEYLLLRLLRRIREHSSGDVPEWCEPFRPEDLCVSYVEESTSTDGGPTVVMRRLRVDERGEFIDRWPDGFFEERAEELF